MDIFYAGILEWITAFLQKKFAIITVTISFTVFISLVKANPTKQRFTIRLYLKFRSCYHQLLPLYSLTNSDVYFSEKSCMESMFLITSNQINRSIIFCFVKTEKERNISIIIYDIIRKEPNRVPRASFRFLEGGTAGRRMNSSSRRSPFQKLLPFYLESINVGENIKTTYTRTGVCWT